MTGEPEKFDLGSLDITAEHRHASIGVMSPAEA
jgi:hypothetical protein